MSFAARAFASGAPLASASIYARQANGIAEIEIEHRGARFRKLRQRVLRAPALHKDVNSVGPDQRLRRCGTEGAIDAVERLGAAPDARQSHREARGLYRRQRIEHQAALPPWLRLGKVSFVRQQRAEIVMQGAHVGLNGDALAEQCLALRPVKARREVAQGEIAFAIAGIERQRAQRGGAGLGKLRLRACGVSLGHRRCGGHREAGIAQRKVGACAMGRRGKDPAPEADAAVPASCAHASTPR